MLINKLRKYKNKQRKNQNKSAPIKYMLMEFQNLHVTAQNKKIINVLPVLSLLADVRVYLESSIFPHMCC